MDKTYVVRIESLACRVTWLIFPVVTAGLIHVLVLKTNLLACLAIPLDSGRRWRGRRLLGANKTWRGVVVMTACTTSFTRLQWVVWPLNPHRKLRHRAGSNLWVAGGLTGLSYCVAELPNSFVKRQAGIPPGARSQHLTRLHSVVDQTDSVVGCLLASRLLYGVPLGEMVVAGVAGTAIHLVVDRVLHLIGVKRATG